MEANRSVDLAVPTGEVVALLEPNGAGKRTLRTEIAGQLLPRAGAITIAGVGMTSDPEPARRFVSAFAPE